MNEAATTGATGEPLLQLEKVTLRFGGLTAVNAVDLTLRRVRGRCDVHGWPPFRDHWKSPCGRTSISTINSSE